MRNPNASYSLAIRSFAYMPMSLALFIPVGFSFKIFFVADYINCNQSLCLLQPAYSHH